MLSDFYATFAEMLGATVNATAAVDSESFYNHLRDPVEAASTNRSAAIVMHGVAGHFAIREGDWKLCFQKELFHVRKGSNYKPPEPPRWQLYNLVRDPRERKNLYTSHPEIVSRLHTLMQKYIDDGRSTEGPQLRNDVPVVLLKDEVVKKVVAESSATPQVHSHTSKPLQQKQPQHMRPPHTPASRHREPKRQPDPNKE
jgi:arylsulfatase A-like enzyme